MTLSTNTNESPRSRRIGRWALPAVISALGIVLIFTGADVMSGSSILPRTLAIIAGIVMSYVGVSRLLRGLFGPAVRPDFWLSTVWVGLVLLGAIFADWLPLRESRDASKTFTAPILQRPDIFSVHPLGTDKFGLDLLGGVVFGARLSLQIAFGAVLIGLIIGGLIGTTAGYFKGRFDAVVSVLTDSLLAFPPLILLLALMVAISPTVTNLSFALALLGIPTYIRLARANAMVVSQREFVVAARSMGARHSRIIFRELVPNVALPLVSYAFIIVAVLIVAEGSLSFLGLSIPRPEPTWGNMINAGAPDMRKTPHLVFVPATVMFLTVFALNRIGDRAREAWDPREAKI